MEEEGMITKYHIKIVRRNGLGQTNDDYHATVTRVADGMELVYIARFKWVLKLKTKRRLLDRDFKYHDRRQDKLEETEEFRR